MAAAGVGVGILVIPLMATISEDAMRSVPDALREASYGVGARKITTTVRVVIPAAVSGLVAAFIVAVSRAIGETMVVFIAAGATGGALFTADVFGPGQTMTAAMASQAAGTDQVARSRPHLPEPLLRRPAALPVHPRAEPVRRPVRAQGPSGLLMDQPDRHPPSTPSLCSEYRKLP